MEYFTLLMGILGAISGGSMLLSLISYSIMFGLGKITGSPLVWLGMLATASLGISTAITLLL